MRAAGSSVYALYLMRRLAQAVPLIFVIIILDFLLIHAAPGDPVDIIAGSSNADPDYIERLRHEFGLDQPILFQLGRFLFRTLSLDLGYSLRFRQDVLSLILDRLPATLLLMVTSLVLSSLFGILLGIAAGRRPHGIADHAATFAAIAGYSMPVFWVGQILLLVFSLELNWLPAQGMVSLRAPREGIGHVVDVAQHLVLPALTYSLYHLTLVFRLTRVKMQGALAEDFITLARAKGIGEGRILFVHALRNAILPVITVIGINFGFMLAGSVLTETVFAWPGTGRLLYEAIMARDYPVLLGLFTFISIAVILVNVITDLVYALVDPRVVLR